MRPNMAAENALGTMGTVCWTIQLLPQIWKSWRLKSTEGLSPWLVLLWGLSAAFMGVYAIVQDLNIPLILQPQLFGALCLASWTQCQYYGVRRSRVVSITLYVAALTVLAGFQVGMVYAVRPSYERGTERVVEAFGIIASIVLSLALFPQYYEIYVHREVVGISVPFMAVDMLGGVFSDLSLVFKPPPFNTIAGISYSLVVFFDGLVLLAAAVLNPRAQRRRKRTAADGASPSPRSGAPDLEGRAAGGGPRPDAEGIAWSASGSTEPIRSHWQAASIRATTGGDAEKAARGAEA